jgi:hypothetical protein
MYSTRRIRADFNRSSQRGVTMVVANAFGERIVALSALR